MQAIVPEEMPDALKKSMDRNGVRPELRQEILRLAEFHTYPAPGVLIGAFMVDFAMELLGVKKGIKLYGVCETPKCLPDALQVLAHITIGNNRLRIVPIGKFAITMNMPSETATADAVRVYVDLEKLKKYPTIGIWYANSPSFDKKTMKGQLFDEIFQAGRNILSFERVRIAVKRKEKWSSVTCSCCGETIPDYLMEGDRCGACGSLKYFERI
ncbi:MAG: FmdE, Molybdenum formylmethanofuran dehydrogenase operon [Methanoregula sp. PtaU1.Bin006]|uniref:FmdE family protein n=1 Tax=Methanoregula sp. PtaU1.Bin006 TaxID=1811681 RepID=UPI0009CC1934|nr:FmdE family protein [Methanoregula sp. PtaU1.Bin006]OPY32798.1 MAG: FmdE, Molybdenum formylmethanofuran dehydrogenase operon [Methanoregula sp. PtaU1.Bin006]